MSTYKKINLSEVKDSAPEFGMGEMGSARFAREAIGATTIGLTNYEMKPGQRVGFGHRHKEAEEVYVVLSGTGRFRIEDEILDVGPKDVVYCGPGTMREWEARSGGLELIAFGSHAENDAEMEKGWWTD